MARYQVSRAALSKITGMHVNSISNFVGGYRRIPWWAAHNLGYGMNQATGLRVFNVDESLGLVAMEQKTEPQECKESGRERKILV